MCKRRQFISTVTLLPQALAYCGVLLFPFKVFFSLVEYLRFFFLLLCVEAPITLYTAVHPVKDRQRCERKYTNSIREKSMVGKKKLNRYAMGIFSFWCVLSGNSCIPIPTDLFYSSRRFGYRMWPISKEMIVQLFLSYVHFPHEKGHSIGDQNNVVNDYVSAAVDVNEPIPTLWEVKNVIHLR